jgi:hypothetical protein
LSSLIMYWAWQESQTNFIEGSWGCAGADRFPARRRGRDP